MPATLLLVNPSKPRRTLRKGKGRRGPAKGPTRRRRRGSSPIVASKSKMPQRGLWIGGIAKAAPSKPQKSKRKGTKMAKKRRSAAQRAATAKMIAAGKAKRRAKRAGKRRSKKTAHKRRRAARVVRVAAPRRRRGRKSAARRVRKNPSHKRRHRYNPSYKEFDKAVAKELSKRGAKRSKAAKRAAKMRSNAAKELRKRASEARKAWKATPKKSARRLAAHSRWMAVRLRAKAASKRGIDAKTHQIMKAHGLTKVNPSFKEIGKNLVTLLPEAAVTVGSMVGLAALGHKVAAKVAAKLPQATPAVIRDNLPAVTALGLGVAAFVGLKKFGGGKMQRFAMPALLGASAAAGMLVLLGTKIGALPAAGAADTRQTLATKLGIPLGEYVGIGDYVGIGVDGWVRSSEGVEVAVNGMGEYVGISGIFDKPTLGEIEQMSEGRQGLRATGSEPRVEQYLPHDEDEDLGSLSGGIFD